MSGVPVEIFEEYGDDAEAALAAFANVAPHEWAEFTESAVENHYRERYRAWKRSQTAEYVPASNQTQLFDDKTMKALTARKTVVQTIDGERHEHEVMALAGEDGAEVLDYVAQRDERPAKTTLKRAKVYRELAKVVRERSIAEGRPVSVAEVLGIAA